MTAPKPTPVISPLVALLRSRKAIAVIVGIFLNILIAKLPPDIAPIVADMRGELMLAITTLILGLVGGISYEDAHKQAPGTTTSNIDISAQTVSSPPVAESERRGNG